MPIATELHRQIGVVPLGVMLILASATVPLILESQTTSLLLLITSHCTTPMRHVALQMIIPLQSALPSQMRPHATLRMNALTQEVHVAWMHLV